MEYLYLIGGLVLLLLSGEALVKGAVGIALQFRVSTLVIGMTIVSFGTSAPELLVSLKAALEGYTDIAIGNVVGSNIANLALILGVTAIVFPIPVSSNSIRIDWPMMVLAGLLFYIFAYDRMIGPWEGLLFVGILLGFGWWLIRQSRRQHLKSADEDELEKEGKRPAWVNGVLVAGGCVGLVYGADFLIEGAVRIATRMGISERIIGLTVIAFGTSLPELVTSGMAAYRKQTDIALGNLIGSCIFNLFAILGITALVKEIPVNEPTMAYDVYWMFGIFFLLFPIMIFMRKFGRASGVLLLSLYLVYTGSLFGWI